MKTILLLYIFLFSWLNIQCQSDKESVSPNQLVVGTWQLTKITPSTGGRDTLPMPDYKEFYEFASDNTFKKYRSDAKTTNGIYQMMLGTPEGDYVKVTYLEDTELNSAFPLSREQLLNITLRTYFFESFGNLPIYTYNRVKNTEKKIK